MYVNSTATNVEVCSVVMVYIWSHLMVNTGFK